MSSKTKILSIDDESQNLTLIEKALKEDFSVYSSLGDEDVVELLDRVKPSIILLDIQLEHTTGYELCKQIRAEDKYKNTVVVFVSSLTSLEDKLTAYGCGGDDYICKPVVIAELKEKLLGYEKRIKATVELEAQYNQASDAAFVSMQQASELGQLIQIFSKLVNYDDYDSLFLGLESYFKQFGVSCSAEFLVNGEKFLYPLNFASTLELEILEMSRSGPRIVTFGRNMLFNSKLSTLLLKNVPVHDQELVGRMRDQFAILCDIVDNRLLLTNRETALTELKSELNDGFADIRQNLQIQEEQMLNLTNALVSQMDLKVIAMGLTEQQENELIGMLEKLIVDLAEASTTSELIDTKVNQINKLMNTFQ